MSRTRVPNQELASDAARANQLVNGGFEVWQRGNGAFTANSAFSADRWMLSLGAASTMSVSKDTTNIDASSGACAACTYVHGATSYFLQKLEDYLQLRLRTVTFSARVRCATANAVRLFANGSPTALVSSAWHSGSGAYETLSVTVTFASNETTPQVGVLFNASCTAYVDNAMLVAGVAPADYVPLSPVDEIARCLRYYESYSLAGGYFRVGPSYAPASAGYVADETVVFRVRKPVTPTVTVNAAGWSSTAAGTPYVAGTAGVDSCVLEIGANAVGMFFSNLFSTTIPGFTVEANP